MYAQSVQFKEMGLRLSGELLQMHLDVNDRINQMGNRVDEIPIILWQVGLYL